MDDIETHAWVLPRRRSTGRSAMPTSSAASTTFSRQTLHLYEREAQGQYRAPVDVVGARRSRSVVRSSARRSTRISESRSTSSARRARTSTSTSILAGIQTPVFFGSALTNFGLEPFLQALVELAPSPSARPSDSGIVNPTDERFTGFVFKIQANMDPRHRDRIAFVRVCSGRFEKDMVLSNSRVGKQLRASRAYRFFGRDRETIDVAYAGDILGLVNPGQFAIGDTVHTGQPLKFLGVPRFPAEHFGRVRLKDTRYKQFDEGLKQLEEEGLMQVFYTASGRREPIVGVVGAASARRHHQPPSERVQRRGGHRARHIYRRAMGGGPLAKFTLGGQGTVAADRLERKVVLFSSQWELEYFVRQHPDVELLAESPPARPVGMIAFSKISKQYGKQVLFVDASFQLNEGEKVGLVGPNGSGKTTLFRMIVGEEGPTKGKCRFRRKSPSAIFARTSKRCQAVRCWTKRLPAAAVWVRCTTSSRIFSTRCPILRRPERWTRSSSDSATVQEEYEHLGGYALESRTREILHGLGFDDERIDGDVGCAVGRMEDARRHGARAARRA